MISTLKNNLSQEHHILVASFPLNVIGLLSLIPFECMSPEESLSEFLVVRLFFMDQFQFFWW